MAKPTACTTFSTRGEMVRCWKPGFPLAGRVWDPKKKAFHDLESYIPVREVQARI